MLLVRKYNIIIEEKKSKKVNEIFCILIYSWIFPVFSNARRSEYDAGDLYKPLKSHKSDVLGDKLCKAWEDEIKSKKATGKRPSLLRASIRVFGGEFMLLGFFLFSLEFFLR